MSSSVDKFFDMVENGGWVSDSTGALTNQVDLETDIIVQEVKELYEERSQVGINKYGTTLEHSTQDLSEFIQHLQEELMDATLYLQKIKKLIK